MIICLLNALSIPQLSSALVFQVAENRPEHRADTGTDQRCFRVPTNGLTGNCSETATDRSTPLSIVTAGVCTPRNHHGQND